MQLRAARAARAALVDALPGPDDLGEAYRLAFDSLDDAQPAAFKLGGTNARTRAVFGVERPYFGPLNADEVHESGAILHPEAFINPVVEPEIVICFSGGWDARTDRRDPAVLAAGLDWVALGLEVPDTPLPNPAEAGVAALLTDRCAVGGLVMGDRLSPEQLLDLERGQVRMRLSDGRVSEAQDDCVPIGGVLSSVADFLQVLGECGQVLPAGCPVATGGLAPARPIDQADRVVAELAGQRVDFCFQPG